MKINWQIESRDIIGLVDFLSDNINAFTKKRWERNVEKKEINITEDSIIHVMIMCLLSSQQRSGPNSPLGKFLIKDPFPINLSNLESSADIELFVKNVLRKNGLTRYINRISFFFTSNFYLMQRENWGIKEKLNKLVFVDSKEEERKLADKLDAVFHGFGPKQSRNFLQALGLTKYEIPLDSRIIGWLNNHGFPIKLNSKSLGDKTYYHFVSDGIQALCEKANIYPCMFDAAVFSSFDKGEWKKENVRF